MAKILVFAGSARKDSINKKLALVAAQVARDAEADVTYVDLADYSMPLYDGDLEEAEGLPENAEKLYAIMKDQDGFILACPEYNSSITPLLKNTIDWCSRGPKEDPPLAAYAGKVVGLMSASPGALGGMRGLVTVRSLLGNIGMWVTPAQVVVSSAYNAFDEDGALTDERQLTKVVGLVNDVIHAAE